MIDFELDGLHPSYQRIVRDTIRGLDADYPVHAVRRVEVYTREGDESLGCTSSGGVIKLNGYWFSQPLDVLREAARTDDQVRLGLGVVVGYHGGMEEPTHLLTHEFGHCLQDVMPGWRNFIGPHWVQSCSDPVHCRPPSGYSLSTTSEFWADCFAAQRLNYPSEAGRMLEEFIIEQLGRREHAR